MSPRGVWTDAEWAAVEYLLFAYWRAEPRLPAAQQRLWRRVLGPYRPADVIDAVDALRERALRPGVDELVAFVEALPTARRAG